MNRGKEVKKFPIIFSCLTITFNAFASWNYSPGGFAFANEICVNHNYSLTVTGLVDAGIWICNNYPNDWIPINNAILDQYPSDSINVGCYRIDFIDSEGDTIILSCMLIEDGVYNSTSTFISTNSGGEWTWLNTDFSNLGADEEQACIDPSNHNRIYYINNYYFATSENFGSFWDYHEIDGFNYDKTKLVKSADSLYFSSYYNYIGGTGEYGGLCKSTDEGQTWNVLIPFYDLWGITEAVVEDFIFLSDGSIAALISNTYPLTWHDLCILISSDFGESWERKGEGLPHNFKPFRIVEDIDIEGRLLTIGLNLFGLYISENYGDVWNQCLNGLPENVSICGDIYQNPDNGIIYLTVDSYGIFESVDHCDNWESYTIPEVGAKGYLSIFESSIFLRDVGYRIWRISNSGFNYEEMQMQSCVDTLNLYAPIAFYSSDTLITGVLKRPRINGVEFFQMLYSYDNGDSWDLGSVLPFIPYTQFDVYFESDTVKFVARNSSGDSLYISSDLGNQWEGFQVPDGQSILDLKLDEHYIYMTTSTNVYKFNKSSYSWTCLNYSGPLPTLILSILGDDIYINTWGNPTSRCYRYDSLNWEMLGETDPYWHFCLTIPFENDTLFFALSKARNTIWLSDDFGMNWTETQYELPFDGQSYAFYDLKYDPFHERIWASTGAGLCYLAVDQLSVDQPTIEFLPLGYITLKACPNPFNPSTSIRFDLPESGEVSLTVYDIAGREVIKLANGYKETGKHEITFDGADLASGIYFARLTIDGGQSMVRKLVLMK